MKHNQFAQNGAELCGVVRGGMVDQARHGIALLNNGIDGKQ